MFFKNKLFLSIIFGLMFLPSLLFGKEGFRIEKYLLGEKQIPNDAYYCVQTG